MIQSMRQSGLFSGTRKELPEGERSKNAELLIQAGFIYKEMAGVYSFLPLGLRVLNNIIEIIREEMNALGGQELFLTALQKKDPWQVTGRWSEEEIDVWFKTVLQNGTELGLGNTHEEPLTALMKDYISSYRDLPIYPYQFQTKFRNELRAKSGIMRAREFIMKDLYSFSQNEQEHQVFYERAKEAYLNIFQRVGLGDRTFITAASGGSFSTYSHEFQTLTEAGEDVIYLDRGKKIAVNDEIYSDSVIEDLGLNKDRLEEVKAVEVGNIFSLGTKFTEALDVTFLDNNAEKQYPIMGSYGIGPGRVMGAIVEILSDEAGIIWPQEVAPFQIHLLSLHVNDEVKEYAERVYKELTTRGVEVLFDDREGVRPGEKFKDADLFGIPLRVVVSEKTLQKDGVELKDRSEESAEIVSLDVLKERAQNL